MESGGNRNEGKKVKKEKKNKQCAYRTVYEMLQKFRVECLKAYGDSVSMLTNGLPKNIIDLKVELMNAYLMLEDVEVIDQILKELDKLIVKYCGKSSEKKAEVPQKDK